MREETRFKTDVIQDPENCRLGRAVYPRSSFISPEDWISLSAKSAAHYVTESTDDGTKDKATNDHTVLGQVAEEFKQKYTDSIWALKTLAWRH